MSFTLFLRELRGKRIEGELLHTMGLSILISVCTLSILYVLRLRDISHFIDAYGLFLGLSCVSYALILSLLRQVRAYPALPCMSGMMVGMGTGMLAGFLPGFYVAGTNGMFVGSVFGCAVGMILGVWSGKCCGVMGVLEGLMAGFMGGLMGGMTAFMLFNDHLALAGILVLFVWLMIGVGLKYMVYLETKDAERAHHEDHLLTIVLTFVLVTVTTWVMVYGPRSAVFG